MELSEQNKITISEIPAKDNAFFRITGEIKKVQNIKSRINEVSRLGYKKIIISSNQNTENLDYNIEIIKIKDLKSLIQMFFN